MQTSTPSPSYKTLPSDADRRRAPRVPLNLLVQHRAPDQESFVKEIAANLSSSGMFLQTPQPKPIGAFVYFQFGMGDDAHYIEGMGQVVRVCDGSGDAPSGMGIQFITVDDESQAHIDAMVKARIAH